MPQFSIPSNVTFQDLRRSVVIGTIAHHRQHLQFVRGVGHPNASGFNSDFDFFQMLSAGNSRRSIVETNQVAHTLLRQILKVAGSDLAQFDLSKRG